MPLSSDFLASLKAAGVNSKVVEYLNDPKFLLSDEASFANFIGKREEIQTSILDQLGDSALKNDAGQRGVLTKVWRECEATEALRLDRKARNVGAYDLEDPLPDGIHDTDVTTFSSTGISWTPAISELLCEPLYGRLKREAASAKSHSVLPLERVRSSAEVPRTAVGKKLAMAVGIDLHVNQYAMPDGPRSGSVRDHHLMVWLTQVLFLGGWSVVGKAVVKGGKPFVSFQACMDYVRFIREHVTPLQGPWPPLARCIRSDFETRSLWASAMSPPGNSTLEEAMVSCTPQQAAIWLWTTESENLNSPQVPTLPQDVPQRSSRRRSRSRSQGHKQGQSSRRRSRSRSPDRMHGVQGNTQLWLEQYTKGLSTTKGKKICQAFNNSPTGCSSPCPHGHLHICNYIYTTRGGERPEMCGNQNKRACTHHARDGGIINASRSDNRGHSDRDKGKGKGKKSGNRR